MCEIKSRSHPKIAQNYRMLVNKLESIKKDINLFLLITPEDHLLQ